jgi:hypothetical protein
MQESQSTGRSRRRSAFLLQPPSFFSSVDGGSVTQRSGLQVIGLKPARRIAHLGASHADTDDVLRPGSYGIKKLPDLVKRPVAVNAQNECGAHGAAQPRILDSAEHTIQDGLERHAALSKFLWPKEQLRSPHLLLAGFRKICRGYIVEVLLGHEDPATFKVQCEEVLKVSELLSSAKSFL